MAKAKIEAIDNVDMFGDSVLTLTKKRGKLNLEEIGDFLRYSTYGMYQGDWVIVIRAGEQTCGGSGWDLDMKKDPGDEVDLYKLEQQEACPVCRKELPPFQYCPECGADLMYPKNQSRQQAIENVELTLGKMKAEAVRMIKDAGCEEAKKAWYHSHLGSIDLARQMGLITEERRQQLYKEFRDQLKLEE